MGTQWQRGAWSPSVDVVQGTAVGLAAGLLVGSLRSLHDWLQPLVAHGAAWAQAVPLRPEFFLLPAQGASPYVEAHLWGSILWIVLFALVALLVGQLLRLYPQIGGSGIPYVEGVLRGERKMHWFSTLWTKFVGVLPVLLAGMAIGREGPSIQMSAAAAAGVQRVWGQGEECNSSAITAGAGAGLAAAFGAPLAGVIFIFEEMRRPFSARLALHCLCASFSAVWVTQHLFHLGQVLPFSSFSGLLLEHSVAWEPSWSHVYPLLGVLCGMMVLGVAAGLCGAAYNGALLWLRDILMVFPLWLRPVPGFVLAALVFLSFPVLLGGGEGIMLGLADPARLAASVGLTPSEGLTSAVWPVPWVLAFLLFAKTAFALCSFCCGVPGGLLMPLLSLGALLGAVVGGGLEPGGFFWVRALGGGGLFPAVNLAVMGMAGAFGGIVRAPLTGVILCAEMTGAWSSVPDMLLVAYMAAAVADGLGSEPIYISLGKPWGAK